MNTLTLVMKCEKCKQNDHTATQCDAINAYAALMSAKASERVKVALTSQDKLHIACYERGSE